MPRSRPTFGNWVMAIDEALKAKREGALRLCARCGAREPRVFGSVGREGAHAESDVVPGADLVEFLGRKRHYCREAIWGVEGGRQ